MFEVTYCDFSDNNKSRCCAISTSIRVVCNRGKFQSSKCKLSR